MLTIIDDVPVGIIGFEASGRVTAHDQIQVLEPALRSTLLTQRSVRLFYRIAADFEGYEPETPLDDTVFGTRHFSDFERIAFLAEDGPYRRAVGAIDGLMPATVRTFSTTEDDTAKAWLAAH